jgi:hypothetical protein
VVVAVVATVDYRAVQEAVAVILVGLEVRHKAILAYKGQLNKAIQEELRVVAAPVDGVVAVAELGLVGIIKQLAMVIHGLLLAIHTLVAVVVRLLLDQQYQEDLAAEVLAA